VVAALPGGVMHLAAVRGHILDNNSICSDFRVLSYMHFTNHLCPALSSLLVLWLLLKFSADVLWRFLIENPAAGMESA
jgi:hypothetical protein